MYNADWINQATVALFKRDKWPSSMRVACPVR